MRAAQSDRLQFHPRKNNWVGYIFQLNNKKIYHAGDTDFIPEMKEGSIVPAITRVPNISLEEAVKMYEATLKELGTISANELEETAKESDEVGAKLENGEEIYTEGFKKGLKAFKESDALALNVKRDYSGPGMPGIVNVINLEMMLMVI